MKAIPVKTILRAIDELLKYPRRFIGVLFLFPSIAFSQTPLERIELNSLQDLIKILEEVNPSKLSFSQDPAEVAKRVHLNLLKILDSQKTIFTKHDVGELALLQKTIAEEIASGQPKFFDRYFEIHSHRLDQINSIVGGYIKPGHMIDLDEEDFLSLGRQFHPEKDFSEIWRKQTKWHALNHLYYTPSPEPKNIPQLLLEGKKKFHARVRQIKSRVQKYTAEKRMLIFINALMQAYDPHSSWMSNDVYLRLRTEVFGRNTKDPAQSFDSVKSYPVALNIKELGKKVEVGYISIPIFYGKNPKSLQGGSVTQDVLKAIKGFKKEPNLLIVDLRNNSGGSLMEAACLNRVFLGARNLGIILSNTKNLDLHKTSDTPKTQSIKCKEKYAKAIGLNLKNKRPVYKENLVILTDSESGSASELFSMTMKSAMRGLLIGSKKTYGKGTGQTLRGVNVGGELHKLFGKSANREFGLKTTVFEFFCPKGSSCQKYGVEPHVVIPKMQKPITETIEEESMFALDPKKSIDSTYKSMTGYLDSPLVDQLKSYSQQRLSSSKAWKKSREALSELAAASDLKAGIKVSYTEIDNIAKKKSTLIRNRHYPTWQRERIHPMDSLFEREAFTIAVQYLVLTKGP